MSPDTIAVGIFTIIGTLREQLEAERQAHAESRRLLAAALERIPPEQPGRVEPQVQVGGAQEDAQRPWWRRWFE